MGYINLSGSQLGEFYALKLSGDKIKKMNFLGMESVKMDNVTLGDEANLRQFKIKMEFNIAASADVSLTVEAELKNQLSRGLDVNLYNSYSKSIKDPAKQLMYFDPNIFPIRSNRVYALVNRITVADSLTIQTDTGIDIDADAKVKVGEYHVQMVNNCEGLLKIKGNNVPVYFNFIIYKPTIVKETQPGLTKSNKTKRVTWEVVSNQYDMDEIEY